MKNYQQLINNIIGQLNGVDRMIKNEKDCYDILVQLQASKAALNSFINKYLEENALNCFKGNCSLKASKQLEKLIKALVKNN